MYITTFNHYTTMVNFHGYNNTCTNDNWPRPRMYMRGRGLNTLVVILSFREFTLRSSNFNITCFAATSLSSWMGKVCIYREPCKVWKVKNVRRNVGFS